MVARRTAGRLRRRRSDSDYLLDKASNYFLTVIVAGLSSNLIGQMLECGRADGSQNLYVYDPSQRSARLAEQGELPWPVEFILTCFHKKFVMPPLGRPHISKLMKAVATWTNKVRWRYFFRSQELDADGDGNQWHCLHLNLF